MGKETSRLLRVLLYYGWLTIETRAVKYPAPGKALLNILDMAPRLYGRENQIEITASEYYDLASYERLLEVGRRLVDQVG